MNAVDLRSILIKATSQHQAGKLSEAEAGYRRVLEVKPDDFTANHMLGVLAHQCGKSADAIQLIRKALKSNPDSASACSNIGAALMQQCQFDEAERYLKKAIRLNPDHADAYHNLGAVQQALGLYEAALMSSLKAISLVQHNATFHNCLANAYHELGDMRNALFYYDKAIALDANYARAHTNRAITLLLTGNFRQGFREYDQWRFKQPGYRQLRSPLPLCTQWQGESLQGKKILLLSEQGLGDSFQFVRYTCLLKQRYDCEIVLACQKHLLQIFKSIDSVDGLMDKDAALPDCDYFASLMSLPAILSEEHPYLPAKPYLACSDTLADKWARILAERDGINIGLAWKGSDEYSADHKRSFDPSVLKPLSKLKGVNWYCMQMDYTEDRLDKEGAALNIRCFPELDKSTGGFMDTAALMSNLDMMITSDTSLAHLSAALGVETCLALCFVPDWRWQIEGETSDWYPSMRLFRQQKNEGWHKVFCRMSDYLDTVF